MVVDPENALAYLVRGLTNRSIGEKKASVENLRRFLELHPNSSHRAYVEKLQL